MQMEAYAPPAALSRAAADIYNAACTRVRDIAATTELGTSSWHLCHEARPFHTAASVRILLGTIPCSLHLSSTAFLLRHPAMPTPEEVPDLDERLLPEEVRQGLLEVCAAPFISLLQRSLGVAVSIEDVDFPRDSPSCSPTLCYVVSFSSPSDALVEEESLVLGIAPEDDAATKELACLLLQLPRAASGFLKDSLSGIPVGISVLAGFRRLDAKVATTLEAGDVILPEEWLPAAQKAVLQLHSVPTGCLQAECLWESGQATMTTPLAEATSKSSTESSMENSNAIEVTLSFELGRKQISLGDLSSLAPGYVFSLSDETDTPVAICANGKTIGRGRIVDLNGTLGIQLMEAVK